MLFKSHNSSRHFAWKPACILLACRAELLNMQWNKSFEIAIMPKNVRYILSQLHLCKLVFGLVLLKMNVHTRTVTLYYISLSTENSKLNMFVLCITRELLNYFMLEGKIEIFEKTNKNSCHFRYRTGGAVHIILYTFLFMWHSPMEISKLRTSICHVSQTFIVQIFS